MKERLATLISGGGTTMQEIIKTCQSGEITIVNCKTFWYYVNT